MALFYFNVLCVVGVCVGGNEFKQQKRKEQKD